MPEHHEVWWSWITGPKKMAKEIIKALESGNNVVLFVPDDLPWRREMRYSVQEKTKYDCYDDFNIKFIDVENDVNHNDYDLNGDGIGRYIIDKYAKDEKIQYGFRGEGTIQDYIYNEKLIEDKVFWFKGMSAAEEKNFLNFCKNYKANGKQGNFVLELKHTGTENIDNFETIFFQKEICNNDLLLFNTIILDLDPDKFGYTSSWMKYIANLCSSLCGTDAELSSFLIQSFDFKTTNPIDALHNAASCEEFIRRGSSKQHILWAVRNGDEERILNDIWEAQLQVFFPMLEIEKINFIKAFEKELKEALLGKVFNRFNKPETIVQRNESGEYVRVTNPKLLELQTIHFMLSLERGHKPVLSIPEKVKNKIKELYNLRNSLAHVNVCEINKFKNLLDNFPFNWK